MGYGEQAAGLVGFAETVAITLDSGSPFGGPGQLVEYMRKCLADWFDGAVVTQVDQVRKGC